jgi:hypothetical protein
MVDSANQNYSSIGGVLFDKGQMKVIQYPSAKAGASYTIPNRVTSIGDGAFGQCINLTNVTIPNSVTSIGGWAFIYCTSLTNVTIPNSVTSIGEFAFSGCWRLTKVFFDGNAPAVGQHVFDVWSPPSSQGPGFVLIDPATVYYLPWTTGWSNTFAGHPDFSIPTAVWLPQVQTTDATFGVRTNQFGFNITWADGLSIVVEATPSLSTPVWSPIVTNTLSGGTFYFSDPQWTKYPSRFYRVRSQ